MLKKVHPHFKRKKYHEWKKNVRQKPEKKSCIYSIAYVSVGAGKEKGVE